MRRLVGLVAVVVLAGCAPSAPADTAAADTAAGRCRQQVDSDPAVKAVMVRASMYGMGLPYQNELAQARNKSFNDCMIAAGVMRPGGVEPVDVARYPLGAYSY